MSVHEVMGKLKQKRKLKCMMIYSGGEETLIRKWKENKDWKNKKSKTEICEKALHLGHKIK